MRTYLFYLRLALIFIFAGQVQGYANEVFDSTLEVRCLQNVRQLTYPTMGFSKAGEAYFSPESNKILFQAVPDGHDQYQIFGMDLYEGSPYLISTGRGACTCSYFRPDGKKILFASSHEDPDLLDKPLLLKQEQKGKYVWDLTPYMNIYEADPDGSNLVRLTSGPAYHAECAYSSDGKRIVFASNSSGTMNIYTMDADGSNVHQVTKTDYSYNGGPFFSPDGTKIIFRSDRERPHYLQIYVINADGTNEKQLTDNKAVNWAPYWHPNGKVIAFTTSLHGHMHYEIYLMNIETGVQCRLTHNPSFDGLPVFSNDGKKVMWTSRRGADNTCQLFIADFIMPQELN